MKRYNHAGEILEAYNTPKSQGGLMGNERNLRIVPIHKSETKFIADGEEIPENARWEAAGLGCTYPGAFYQITTTTYKVVADVPSGAFVFERNYGEFGSYAEALEIKEGLTK